MYLLLNLDRFHIFFSAVIVDFEQLILCWDEIRIYCLFRIIYYSQKIGVSARDIMFGRFDETGEKNVMTVITEAATAGFL